MSDLEIVVSCLLVIVLPLWSLFFFLGSRDDMTAFLSGCLVIVVGSVITLIGLRVFDSRP